jgi:DNA-binding XRE family transcriptional regulator
MADFRLDNYLRMYRKRSALSQEEVAFLLGIQSGTEVSRHEKNRRVPTLDTALAYEAIFGQPSGELFAGRLERLQRRIARRAGNLAERLRAGEPDARTAAKLDALMRLTNTSLDL